MNHHQITDKELEELKRIAYGGMYDKRKAEKLFDDVIRWCVKERDGWKCRFHPIGRLPATKLDHCHIIPRRHHSTRWLLANGITACYGCHQWFDRDQHLRRKHYENTSFATDQKRRLIEIGWGQDALTKLVVESYRKANRDLWVTANQLLNDYYSLKG